MNNCGCETKNKKNEEKKNESGSGYNHGAEKTATNNQWGK